MLIDDDRDFLFYFKEYHAHVDVQYESNPVSWLDDITFQQADLNKFDLIFCDFYFSNLNQNAFQLKISKYIREHGFKNKLVLLSALSDFEEDFVKNESFDLILKKLDLDSIDNILTYN